MTWQSRWFRLLDALLLIALIAVSDLEQSLQDIAGLEAGGAAAFSVPGSVSEELVLLCEVARSQVRGLDAPQVIFQVRARIAGQHGLVASDVLLLKSRAWPRTTSGKLQRGLCRDMYLAIPSAGGLEDSFLAGPRARP